MARFQGKRVSRNWDSVLNQARRERVRFTLNSGRRTMREQWALYNAYRRGSGVLAAFPSPFAPHIRTGRQDHAIDVDALDGGEQRLQNWLNRHGLAARNTVRGEAWHLEVDRKALRRFARRIRRHQKAKRR